MIALQKKRVDERWADVLPCISILVIVLVLTPAILIFEVLVSRTVESSWSSWEAFGPCSTTCGDGLKVRWRSCTGQWCWGPEKMVENCNLKPCQDDEHYYDDYYDEGEWSNWSTWNSCSATCDVKGFRERQRTCLGTSDEGSQEPPSCEGMSKEVVECLEPCLTGNATSSWEEWSAFGECSVTCGTGHKTRNRSCSNGLNCTGEDSEAVPCNNQACAIDGHWGEWSDFTECQPPCGEGNQTRQRSCDNPFPSNNGSVCNGSDTETRKCNSGDCFSWSNWSAYTSCSVSCGNGTQTRSRQCVDLWNSTLQTNCTGPSLENISCFSMECPNFWSDWSTYTSCSVSCGNGTQTRWRQCVDIRNLTLQTNCTGPSLENISCFSMECPNFWSDWSAYTSCSVSCGNGTQTRWRQCVDISNLTLQTNCTGPSLENISCFSTECTTEASLNCSTDNGGCSHFCLRNSTMSFCSCPAGYALDAEGKTCLDVNECEGANSCEGFCVNSPGSYYCLCYKSNHYWDRKLLLCIPNLKKNRSPLKPRDSKDE